MKNVRRLCRAARRGFTLLELIVVVLIVGILAAFAVPEYMRSLEIGKAEDAVALVNMVATTNRMYALDHSNNWTTGDLTDACNAAACVGGNNPPACDLIGCKYLASGSYDAKPYVLRAQSPLTAASCLSLPAGNYSACAKRRTSGPNSTSLSPYTGWGYVVNGSGVISRVPDDASGPPEPTQ